MAKLKDCGFCWSGLDCTKRKRTEAENQDSLATHAKPLLALFEVAKSKYPRHFSLRKALEELDSTCSIKPQHTDPNWTDIAATRWGVMVRQTWEIAEGGKFEPTSNANLDALFKYVKLVQEFEALEPEEDTQVEAEEEEPEPESQPQVEGHTEEDGQVYMSLIPIYVTLKIFMSQKGIQKQMKMHQGIQNKSKIQSKQNKMKNLRGQMMTAAVR